MILKLRVPNYVEKHLIQRFTYNGEILFADLTIHRRQMGYGDIPVYTVDENEDAQIYGVMDGEELTVIGVA